LKNDNDKCGSVKNTQLFQIVQTWGKEVVICERGGRVVNVAPRQSVNAGICGVLLNEIRGTA
jgi:hypothetical protein